MRTTLPRWHLPEGSNTIWERMREWDRSDTAINEHLREFVLNSVWEVPDSGVRVSGKCLMLFYCTFDSCRLLHAGPSACGGIIGSAPAVWCRSAGSLVGLRRSEGFESCAPEIQQRLAVVSLKKAEPGEGGGRPGLFSQLVHFLQPFWQISSQRER